MRRKFLYNVHGINITDVHHTVFKITKHPFISFINYILESRYKFCKIRSVLRMENRIYREELKESLGMNFFSPFQPERKFKVYKSYECSQIICRRVH